MDIGRRNELADGYVSRFGMVHDDAQHLANLALGQMTADVQEENDWSVTATGWDGEEVVATIEPEPEVEADVAAAVETQAGPSIGQIIDAVAGGIGRQISELTQALTALGSRPIEMTVPPELTAAVQNPPQVIVQVPEQPAPIVQITVPEQPAPQITVQVPEQPAPVVNVEAPTVEVNVPAPNVSVTVEQPDETESRRVTFQRDASGRIVSAEVIDEPEL